MPGKANFASAWVNHMAGRSAQNGRSRAVTLDISAGSELSVVCIIFCWGHQCEICLSPMWVLSLGEETTTYTNIYCVCTEHMNELWSEDFKAAGCRLQVAV
jgi:hypothetical protein